MITLLRSTLKNIQRHLEYLLNHHFCYFLRDLKWPLALQPSRWVMQLFWAIMYLHDITAGTYILYICCNICGSLCIHKGKDNRVRSTPGERLTNPGFATPSSGQLEEQLTNAIMILKKKKWLCTLMGK